MARRPTPRPTDAELEILSVLWKLGSSTVREVCEQLNQKRPTGYTTALKLLQIMSEKGLVERDASQRAHRYRSRTAKADTQGRLIGDLLDRAFGGSAMQLVMRALSDRRTSPKELVRIRKLIDELEKESNE